MEGLQGFLGDIGAAYREEKRKQRSNDIIDFIAANWRFFTPTRSAMNAIVSQLGQQVPHRCNAVILIAAQDLYESFSNNLTSSFGGY